MNKLVFCKNINFCIDNVYCKYYLCDINKPVVITFGHMGATVTREQTENSVSPWGFDYVKGEGYNVISFVSIGESNWYQSDMFYKYLVEVLSKNLSVFTERFGYGVSMGAYAVSLYANSIKMTRVLLLSPFFVPESKKNNNLPDCTKMKANGYVIYDSLLKPDKKNAEKYINLIHLRLPGIGHHTPDYLLEMGMLKSLFKDFINNRIIPLDFINNTRLKKRKLPIYYYNMLYKYHMTPLRKKIILRYKKDNNVNLDEVLMHHKIKIKENYENADILREVSLYFEINDDIETAYKIMKKALQNRSNGEFIKEKILEFEKELGV